MNNRFLFTVSGKRKEQLGPYRFWCHCHEIREEAAGVVLIDRVCYQPFFGVQGRLLHRLYIRRTLERSFDYRREWLAEFLAAPSPPAG